MSYGFNFINDSGNVIVDANFTSLTLYAIVPVTWGSGSPHSAGVSTRSVGTTITIDAGYEYVVAISPANAAICGCELKATWNGSAWITDPTQLEVWVSCGSASYPANGTVWNLYVYSNKKTIPPAGAYGLRVFNSAGAEVFNSEAQGMDIFATATIPISSFTETTISISNPNNYDFAFMLPKWANGYYCSGDVEGTLAIRKISNTQLGAIMISTDDYSKSGGMPSGDTRQSIQLPIFKKPV